MTDLARAMYPQRWMAEGYCAGASVGSQVPPHFFNGPESAPRPCDKSGGHRKYIYNLSDCETHELTEEFLSTKTVAVPGRLLCFEIEGSDPFSNIARQVEREVFEERFGNDPVMLTREYWPYEDSSLFFVALDTDAKVPAGVLRMIRNSPAGLKTLVDLADPTITPNAVPTDDVLRFHAIDDLDRCWDGATATVRRRYRRRLPAIHSEVLRSWYGAAVRENVEHLVSILDAPVFKVVRHFLGVPLVPLADTAPFTYMDGLNHQAVYAHVDSAVTSAARVNRKVGQKIRDCFAEGRLSPPELMRETQRAD